jgi:hypothetical protein
MLDPNGGMTKISAAYGGINIQNGSAVTYDKSGNLVLLGSYSGTINLGGSTLTSAGSSDIFVAKFNPAGQLLWAKSFGDAEIQSTSSVGVDSSGNVYLTGIFRGSVNFGGGPLTAAGQFFVDIYLAKLSSDGNHVWSKRFGDDNVQNARGLAIDTAGNVLLTGFFQNDVNFGGATLTSAGLYDIFLAKFNSDGMHLWSRRFGDAGADQNGKAVAVDSMGNVYLAGDVGGSTDFGNGAMMASATKVAFVGKFDSLGVPMWVKLSTGMGTDKAGANAVAVGPNGEVAIGGNFRGAFDLGGGSVTNLSGDDAFVTLFDNMGMHTFTKTYGDVDSQTALGVAVAANGDVITTGNYSGMMDVGTGMPVTSAGGFDGYSVRWDNKGCTRWLRTYAGNMAHLTQGLALDPTTGGFAITGSFNGTADFGTGALTASEDDVFLIWANP